MNNFINDLVKFFQTYWREIVDVSVLIISVVICLIRKRPCINEIDAIKKDVLDKLPTLINAVERPGDGCTKKDTVIQAVKAFISKKYHISLTDDLIDFISVAIEDILSTPKKKGE